MKKFLGIVLAITGFVCFAQNLQQKQQKISVTDENRRIATALPSKIIDPRTYQDTSAKITYVDTNALVQRGRQILEYNNGKPNSSGYTPHYDPNTNNTTYVRIPRSGKEIYGNRW